MHVIGGGRNPRRFSYAELTQIVRDNYTAMLHIRC